MPTTRTRVFAALVADAVSIIIFAAIGRRSHDESGGVGSVLTTAAPFLVALALGWALATALRQARARPSDLLSVDAGVIIWIVTSGAGLVLRRTLWDRGTALAFVIVAVAFLGVFMVGWRAAYGRTRRTRAHA